MPTNLFKIGDWLYILPIAALGLVLGVYGFMTCPDCSAVAAGVPGGGPTGFVPGITHTLGLIKAVGNFPLDRTHWPLFFAQVIMPALAFVSVFKLVLQSVRRDARVLLAQRLKDHTIVCGLGTTGRQIVESFRDAHMPVVVIALNAGTPDAAACERRHVVVLEGDAGQPSMLKLAGLKRANALIIACGSDGANLEIGMRARDVLGKVEGRTVKILPELRSEWLYDLVKTQNAGTLGTDQAEFQLFNLNANAARHLLRSQLFLRAVPEAPLRPHIMFAGFGRVATEILMQAARCNFAVPGQKLSATVLDERGPASIALAEAACADVGRIADIDFQACEFTADNGSWQPQVRTALQEQPPLAVIVAVKLDDVALNTAIRFRKLLDELGLFATPVFVRIREQHRLGAFLSQLEAQSLFQNRLIPFGSLAFLTRPTAILDQSLDALARAAHDTWLRSNAQSDSPAAVPWEKLAEFHKQANRGLADYIPIRLRCCGMRLVNEAGPALTLAVAEIEKLAALEHWRWCVELLSLGWRYAPARDDFQKLHNRLVDWAELPDGTKNYNREMARLLPEIAAAAGMSIKRDRVLFADLLGDGPLDTSDSATQFVVAADPRDGESMRRAWAAQAQGAKVWALLRAGTSPQLFKQQAGGPPEVEFFLREEEWTALRQQGAGA
jgi:hypothetical protein